MRNITRLAPILFAVVFAGCGDSPVNCCEPLPSRLRVINAFTAPVDVLVDGSTVAANLAAGAIDTIVPSPGAHTLTLRPSTGPSASQSVTTAAGALNTVAVVRLSSGAVSTQVLD